MDALNSRVYAIQLPSHLLAQPHHPTPFLPEDIHICGNCKQSFTDIRVFLQHKHDCNAFMSSATAALLETPSSRVNLQMLSDEPLLQVMINEDNHQVIIHSDSHNNEESELDTTSDPNTTAAAIAATTLLQCSGNVQMTETDSRRNMDIDEEDVASLLASQFAKEAVYLSDSANNVNSGDVYSGKNSTSEHIDVTASSSSNPPIYFQETTAESEEVVTVLDAKNEVNNNSSNVPPEFTVEVEVESNVDVEETSNTIQKETNNQAKKEIPKLLKNPSSLFLTRKVAYCDQCNFVTLYSADLTRHMRKHTGEKPYECSICKQRFSRRDKLQTHLRIHTGDKPYRCQFCNYAATDSGPLRKHIRTHTDERPFKCQFCQYRAKDTSQLTVHLRKHTGDAPFICQVEKCGRAFKTSSDLKRHGITHRKVHQFACKQCDYKASNKFGLQAHNQLSHNTNPLNCDVCGDCFKPHDLKELEAHRQRLHPDHLVYNSGKKEDKRNQKNYSSGLVNNNNTNGNNKSHRCTFCSHQSRTQNGLKQHIRKQHASSGMNVSGGSNGRSQSRPLCQKTHHCSYCSASFVREDSLRSHLKQHQTIETGVSSNSPNVSCSSGSKDANKDVNVITVDQSSNLADGDSFFIENIIDEEYILK